MTLNEAAGHIANGIDIIKLLFAELDREGHSHGSTTITGDYKRMLKEFGDIPIKTPCWMGVDLTTSSESPAVFSLHDVIKTTILFAAVDTEKHHS